MHIALGIIIRRTKLSVQGQQKLEKLWRNKTAIVVDKMSIISLNFFATVDLYLGKAKFLHKNLFAVLGGLFVIIFFNNFFQFLSIIKQSL